jgi:uncharacterized membrane protein YgdD (TMEM256/DUF423 family)
MNQRSILITGTILAGLAVILGAFGAHAFKDALEASDRTGTYELAVRYQFYHALALLLAGILMNQFDASKIRYTGLCFLLGVIFFSGSLFLLCATGVKVLGAVTPIGGIFFIAGWIILLLAVQKK